MTRMREIEREREIENEIEEREARKRERDEAELENPQLRIEREQREEEEIRIQRENRRLREEKEQKEIVEKNKPINKIKSLRRNQYYAERNMFMKFKTTNLYEYLNNILLNKENDKYTEQELLEALIFIKDPLQDYIEDYKKLINDKLEKKYKRDNKEKIETFLNDMDDLLIKIFQRIKEIQKKKKTFILQISHNLELFIIHRLEQ